MGVSAAIGAFIKEINDIPKYDTIFAVYLFPVANGALFVPKNMVYRFRVS